MQSINSCLEKSLSMHKNHFYSTYLYFIRAVSFRAVQFIQYIELRLKKNANKDTKWKEDNQCRRLVLLWNILLLLTPPLFQGHHTPPPMSSVGELVKKEKLTNVDFTLCSIHLFPCSMIYDTIL